MPNNKSKSRTQKPKSGRKQSNRSAAPAVYASNTASSEIKAFYAQEGNFQLFHNVPSPYFNLTNIFNSVVQGTSYNNRIGNKIHVRDFEVLMIVNNKLDRPNVTYRFMLVAAPATTSTDTATELFAAGGITGLHIITNSVLLHDIVFPVNQGSTQATGSNKERSYAHRVSVPINRSIVYNTDNFCATRLLGFVVAYDAFGTLITDNIASVAQTSYRLTYTDA